MTPLELDEIARALRAGRPAVDKDFAAKLDAWAADGFARRGPEPAEGGAEPPRTDRPKTRAPRRRWLMPAFGFAATCLLVGGVVISSLNTGDDDELGASGTDIGTIEEEAAPPRSPEVTRDLGAKGEASLNSTFPAGQGRIKEERAGLTLSTEESEVGDVTDDAAQAVTRYGGIVDTMTVSEGDGRESRGRIEARIPVQNFQVALAEISDLGNVEARNQAAIDITRSYGIAGKRFVGAKARVDSLRAQLAAATDPSEIASLEQELAEARRDLASARAELRSNKQRGDFARLSLAVVGEEGGWGIGDAADDAAGVLEWIGGALLVSLAVLIPLAVLGAALWFGSAGLRRRRRERVLDE